MSARTAARIRLCDPSELMGAVPQLLVLPPQDCVVVLTLHGKNLGLTLRAVLVPPDRAPQLAVQLLRPITRAQPNAIVLVVIGGDSNVDDDIPHRALVAAFAH